MCVPLPLSFYQRPLDYLYQKLLKRSIKEKGETLLLRSNIMHIGELMIFKIFKMTKGMMKELQL